MILAKKALDGTLTNIQDGRLTQVWPDGSVDVELVAMPPGFGRYTYDAINKLAVLRAPRTLPAIFTDLNALTAGQKANVATDLYTGTALTMRILNYTGPNAALIAITYFGLPQPLTAAQKIGLVAAYVQDNPLYLVHPAFDASINVAGDA